MPVDEQHPISADEPLDASGPLVSKDLPEGLPGFNWGAFLIPPLWGVAYGQWAGVFFLPVWAFVDNMIRGSYELGLWTSWVGWGMAVTTLALQAGYARTANRIWWHRTRNPAAVERYVRHQRIWAIVGVVTVIAMAVWIALFITSGHTVVG